MERMRKETVADTINLVLGAFLFLSPWMFGFANEAAASWNAWLSGIVVAALAIAALSAFAEWEEWIELIVGVWVAASPWLVGFTANATAMWLHVVIGIIVAVAAAVRLWIAYNSPPHVTA